jgi:hypothetical protein
MTLVMSLLVIMSLRSKPRVRVLVVDTVSGARDSGLGACSASPLTTLSRCRCAPKKCEKLNHKGHEGTRRTNSARPKPTADKRESELKPNHKGLTTEATEEHRGRS